MPAGCRCTAGPASTEAASGDAPAGAVGGRGLPLRRRAGQVRDALFADRSKLDAAGLSEHASSLALDVKSFRACLANGKHKAGVEEDFQAGAKAGVTGTPAFFINGVFLSGAQPRSEFEKIIDAELAMAAGRGAAR